MEFIFRGNILQKRFVLCFLFLLLLLIGGCGSSGGSDPKVCPGDPGCPKEDPSPDPESLDFTGEWDIYEEHQGGLFGYRQYHYTIDIEQTGTQAILSKENEHLTCNVVGEDLVCEGTFTLSEPELTVSCVFDSYTLRYDGSSSIVGEASWSYSVQGNVNYGRSNLTTTRPEAGSIRIRNLSDYTFPLLNLRICGSIDWGENQTGIPIESGHNYYYRDIIPGCYDIRACEDEEIVDDAVCAHWDDVAINEGETRRLVINP